MTELPIATVKDVRVSVRTFDRRDPELVIADKYHRVELRPTPEECDELVVAIRTGVAKVRELIKGRK